MSFNKDNSGSISRNDRKEKETHPDLKGKCTIGGKKYWISGWKKTNDSGPWVSLAFEEVKEKTADAPPPRKSERDSAW
jgi:hypothetical protein